MTLNPFCTTDRKISPDWIDEGARESDNVSLIRNKARLTHHIFWFVDRVRSNRFLCATRCK